MTAKRSGDLFKPFEQSFLIKALLFPLGLIYRLWALSVRFEYAEEDGFQEISESNTPLVFFLWHNRLFLAGEWHRRFRRKRTCYGLISASRDGAWLETFYGWAGIYEAKPGAILLARITKSPICLLSFKYSGHWALKSWDRFVVPFPFSRVKVYTHILSSEVLFKEGCDDKAKEIAQSGLMKITQD